jgi:hypothetical protein
MYPLNRFFSKYERKLALDKVSLQVNEVKLQPAAKSSPLVSFGRLLKQRRAFTFFNGAGVGGGDGTGNDPVTLIYMKFKFHCLWLSFHGFMYCVRMLLCHTQLP